ncbi:MAG: glycosyltransferase [Dysgonamonadaceae bacterium]|jgi:glycosyltransferase involved in cell wall biosynthesis|nr:glycosyltransferase [Dysgonamonadaceae bacterium]
MISIITAIHNQVNMNRLFWDYLLRYTDNPFELIIVDNISTDGSREFFRSLPEDKVKVIENDANYSYAHCQNQGIAIAKYDVLVFLNNDVLVSKHWDKRLLEVLGRNKREVLSFASNDRIFNKIETDRLSRRWKRIKYPLMYLFGQSLFSLKLMVKLCYGNWERYTSKIFNQYGYSFTVGFSGSAIAMTRKAVELLGMWDISQQGADFDLFYRSCLCAETTGNIEPMSIINGVFIHHYRRLTLYSKHPVFKDKDKLRSIESKWTREQIDRWMKYVKFLTLIPTNLSEKTDTK